MKMQFSMYDRILILAALPAENNVIILKIIKGIKDKFGFDDSESALLKTIDIGNGQQNIVADPSAPIKEIEIGPKGFEVIADSLKRMNEQKKLTLQHLELYDKFVENAPKEL
jgi:hypothetical protein